MLLDLEMPVIMQYCQSKDAFYRQVEEAHTLLKLQNVQVQWESTIKYLMDTYWDEEVEN